MTHYADISVERGPRRDADPQPDRSTMRLLVIEDDRDAADYLIKSFREVGHVAEQANDGEAGLARKSAGGRRL